MTAFSYDLKALGSNLEFVGTVINSSGSGEAGLTATLIIQRASDSQYWNNVTIAWQVAVPTAFTIPDLGNGKYKLTLIGAFDTGVFQYTVTYVDNLDSNSRTFDQEYEIVLDANIKSIAENSVQATKLAEAMKGTITGVVSAVPTTATVLIIKTLSNDSNANLNIADVLKDRTLTMTSGLLHGKMIGIISSTASASEPYTIGTSTMVNFANIAINDTFIIA